MKTLQDNRSHSLGVASVSPWEFFRPHRTLVRRVVTVLLVGLLLSLAVAWSLVLVRRVGWSFQDSAAAVAWAEEWRHRWHLPTAFRYAEDHGGVRFWLVQTVRSPVTDAQQTAYRLDSGWPMRCLSYTYTVEVAWTGVGDQITPDRPMSISDGLPLPPRWTYPAYGSNFPMRLPIVPLWFGLAANAGLYAAAGLGLWQGFWIARCYRRLRLGRCPRCGYSLAGGRDRVCPECGR